MMTKFISFVCLFIVFGEFTSANDDFESLSVLNIEHSFDPSSTTRYFSLGTVTIRSLANNIAQFSGDALLTNEQRSHMQKLLENQGVDGLYRIRIPFKIDKKDEYVENSIPICQLIQSKLSVSVTVSVDGSGTPVGIHIDSPDSCNHSKDHYVSMLESLPHALTVHSYLQSPSLGAAPETVEYLKKIEKQREEKMRSEQGDNRSFLAKYWYYIVPLFLFLMLASNAAEQGGGGGGR